MSKPKPKPTQKSSVDLVDVHASIEDIKRQLDAIVKAMIAPQLGKNDKEARKHLSKYVKTELGAKIWNTIDGKRNVGNVSTAVGRTPQVVNKYIQRWEQASPPLVYVFTEVHGAKVYKRIYPIRMKARAVKKPLAQQPSEAATSSATSNASNP